MYLRKKDAQIKEDRVESETKCGGNWPTECGNGSRFGVSIHRFVNDYIFWEVSLNFTRFKVIAWVEHQHSKQRAQNVIVCYSHV